MRKSLGVSLLVQRLRTEGIAGTIARAGARLAERRRSAGFRPAPAGWAPRQPVPVLQVLPTFPTTPFGGVEVQLRARLDRGGDWALLRRTGDAVWRLEVSARDERVSLELRAAPPAAWALESRQLEAVVREAAERVGAGVLHFETALGFPLASLRTLARDDLRTILSIHDFALFCPRPHLFSPELAAFCEYSTDETICHRCLRHSWPAVPSGAQADRRAVVPSLLASCSRVVFPSEFLRRQHAALFGTAASSRTVVVPPFGAESPVPPRDPGPVRRVAFLGGGHPHKGADCFEAVVGLAGGRGLGFVVYGGDPLEGLARLRRSTGVRIRGTYRPGSLGAELRRDAIDLALLLPAVPESYCLTLDECVLAGVPVIAFDRGALAGRVGELDAGWLVPAAEGATAVARLLRDLAERHAPVGVPAASRQRLLESRRHAREQMRSLYDELAAGRKPTR